MSSKNDTFRLTIDIPKADHKILKTLSAISGKSMKEMVGSWIHKQIHKKNIPNAETLKIMKDIEMGENLHHAKDIQDMFRQLGI